MLLSISSWHLACICGRPDMKHTNQSMIVLLVSVPPGSRIFLLCKNKICLKKLYGQSENSNPFISTTFYLNGKVWYILYIHSDKPKKISPIVCIKYTSSNSAWFSSVLSLSASCLAISRQSIRSLLMPDCQKQLLLQSNIILNV